MTYAATRTASVRKDIEERVAAKRAELEDLKKQNVPLTDETRREWDKVLLVEKIIADFYILNPQLETTANIQKMKERRASERAASGGSHGNKDSPLAVRTTEEQAANTIRSVKAFLRQVSHLNDVMHEEILLCRGGDTASCQGYDWTDRRIRTLLNEASFPLSLLISWAQHDPGGQKDLVGALEHEFHYQEYRQQVILQEAGLATRPEDTVWARWVREGHVRQRQERVTAAPNSAPSTEPIIEAPPAPPPSPEELQRAVKILENATYRCQYHVGLSMFSDGDIITYTLKDGSWKGPPWVPGTASHPYARAKREYVAVGDFNHDGKSDGAIVVLETGGGSGTDVMVYAFTDVFGAADCTHAVMLGDRVRVDQIFFAEDGALHVNMRNHLPNEGFGLTPTHQIERRFVLAGSGARAFERELAGSKPGPWEPYRTEFDSEWRVYWRTSDGKLIGMGSAEDLPDPSSY